MNYNGEDEDHTLIHLSTWIRRNVVVNEHTVKDSGHKDQQGVHAPNKQDKCSKTKTWSCAGCNRGMPSTPRNSYWEPCCNKQEDSPLEKLTTCAAWL